MDTHAEAAFGTARRGTSTPLGDPRLAARLRRELRGEVLFSSADRGRYATDASIYQVPPVGAVVPRDAQDVQTAMAIAREHDVPVLARGAGTSQCGQTVNRALVLDFTRHMHGVLAVDRDARTATVQPGIVLQHLNMALKGTGLFFPVDPSTQARCTIGGMAGNNSCGGKSIRYGLMADNVRAIDAILADGTRHRFGELPEGASPEADPAVRALLARLREIGAAEASEVARRFPRQLRRVGGYNLDAIVPGGTRPRGSMPGTAFGAPGGNAAGVNLARLLVGSEGTLAVSASIELALSPLRPRKVLGICQFPTFRAAMEAAEPLVALGPDAVELVDRTMIELGRGIPIYRRTVDRMVQGEPDSLLIVEFHGEEDGPLLQSLARLEELMADLGHPGAVVRATDPAFQADVAEVREAGLNIMMSMKGDAKPVSFIEDCAVDLADLPDYTARLEEAFARHGTKGTWYAHASVGCLHVRPVLSMKDAGDVRTMRAVAEECFALVREYKGSHSGEHGDGIARSEFNEPMFGSRLARAFEAVKDAFDPDALLNPGRVVRPPRMDDRTLFRYGPDYAATPAPAPRLDWSEHPNGLLGAVEMCNNNGTCRKLHVGAMCPSYRVTGLERDVVRGRANTLRLALTGQLGAGEDLAGEAVRDALSLCVSCKACRRECPTGVDVARMKLEATAARAARHGVSARERLVAELPRYAALAGRLAPLSNLRNRAALLRRLGERATGLSAARDLPRFRRDRFRDDEADATPAPRGDVLLLADTFNRHFEPWNLRAAVRVLRAAGYRAVLPPAPGRPACCGRTYLSAGMLDRARAEMRRALSALSGTLPVVGLEPSCLLTLRDELPALLPGPDARALSERAVLLGEFLARTPHDLAEALERAAPRVAPAVAHAHGHCHQKAFGVWDSALASLRLRPNLDVRPIESSCCGMAGAFGYGAEAQAASRAMAELSLLPRVRAAAAADLVVADGTSCRHQIADLGGRGAVHSAVVLAEAL